MIKASLNAFQNLFGSPATINYPFEKSPKNKEARGLILFEEPKCIWCLQCEDVCPPGAIRFTQDRESFKFTYHYNPYLCIYCTECVRVCPDKAQALAQCDELSPPCHDENMNDDWFLIEKEALSSKEECKILKKAKKENP
ncbi:MAG TPA: 4Fe-4S dicluster domain-containing protein [Campylobacterales bacterium]|nr:4Fe-4S dicluster domain-containing protein [Campylobacterales bacterium]